MQAQILATEESENAFGLLDLFFSVFFTVELVVNLFGTLVLEFVRDPWNWLHPATHPATHCHTPCNTIHHRLGTFVLEFVRDM